jgi:hypothetical protein
VLEWMREILPKLSEPLCERFESRELLSQVLPEKLERKNGLAHEPKERREGRPMFGETFPEFQEPVLELRETLP